MYARKQDPLSKFWTLLLIPAHLTFFINYELAHMEVGVLLKIINKTNLCQYFHPLSILQVHILGFSSTHFRRSVLLV